MCSYCEKTFRTREGLKDHEDIIHTKVGLKHCAACGEEFTTNRGLKSHMNLKHGVEERFQCKYCGFYFLSAEGHRAHEELAPCKANTCDICGRMYFQAMRHHHFKSFLQLFITSNLIINYQSRGSPSDGVFFLRKKI